MLCYPGENHAMTPRLRHFVYFLDFEMYGASRGRPCDRVASCMARHGKNPTRPQICRWNLDSICHISKDISIYSFGSHISCYPLASHLWYFQRFPLNLLQSKILFFYGKNCN